MTTLAQDLSTTQIVPSKAGLWAGRILTAIPVLFLLMDGVMKLFALPLVTQSMAQLGYRPDAGLARGLGTLLLACLALYVLPRTSVLGALVLTGYLGGAIASHVRVGDPLFSHVLF